MNKEGEANMFINTIKNQSLANKLKPCLLVACFFSGLSCGPSAYSLHLSECSPLKAKYCVLAVLKHRDERYPEVSFPFYFSEADSEIPEMEEYWWLKCSKSTHKSRTEDELGDVFHATFVVGVKAGASQSVWFHTKTYIKKINGEVANE